MIDKIDKDKLLNAKMILKDAYEKNIKVEFICHFKGIPLIQETVIDKLTRHYILFKTFSANSKLPSILKTYAKRKFA